MAELAIRTEHEFSLPHGLVDAAGERHADGVMRLATARDEIEPLRDPDVRRNEAYLSVLLLARTIVRIGPITDITPDLVAGLFAADFDHLQRLYERLNGINDTLAVVECPECAHRFDVDLSEAEQAQAGK